MCMFVAALHDLGHFVIDLATAKGRQQEEGAGVAAIGTQKEEQL